MRLFLLALLASTVACNLGGAVSLDGRAGDEDANEADTNREDSTDAEGLNDVPDGARDEGDALPSSGPLTMVMDEIEMLDERLCDLDGDGQLDNAVADLGMPYSRMLVGAIGSIAQGQIEEGRRLVFHFPWLDDLATPHDEQARMIILEGLDVDDPDNDEDDFSGDEPFHGSANSLAACGEPEHFFQAVSIAHGLVTASSGTITIPIATDPVVTHGAQAEGNMDARGRGMELRICSYAPMSELGVVPATYSSDLTALEAFAAGGEAFGFTGIPGMSPDVDVDGDGLELLLLDGSNHLEACVDGDGTVIAGRDCHQDDRIADGFSVATRAHFVRAVFAGREPGWEEELEDRDRPCDGELPDPSLWDPE